MNVLSFVSRSGKQMSRLTDSCVRSLAKCGTVKLKLTLTCGNPGSVIGHFSRTCVFEMSREAVSMQYEMPIQPHTPHTRLWQCRFISLLTEKAFFPFFEHGLLLTIPLSLLPICLVCLR